MNDDRSRWFGIPKRLLLIGGWAGWALGFIVASLWALIWTPCAFDIGGHWGPEGPGQAFLILIVAFAPLGALLVLAWVVVFWLRRARSGRGVGESPDSGGRDGGGSSR